MIDLKKTFQKANEMGVKITQAEIADHYKVRPQRIGALSNSLRISPIWNNRLIKYFNTKGVDVIEKE